MTIATRCIAFAALVLAVALTGVVGCGGAAEADDELVVLSPHWEGIQREFESGFERQWLAETGRTVKITWLDQGGTSSIDRYIRSEFSRDSTGIGVDVFFGGGVDPYLRLAESRMTESYMLPDSIASRIPESFAGIPLYDARGRWYGATMSGFGVIYNRAVARLQGTEPPTEWADMGDPRLFGWVAGGDPRMSGSVHMAYEIMLQAYGWERGWRIVTALAANTRAFARSAGDIPLRVSRGDAVAGMCIDFYAWSEINKSGTTDLGFVYPENLTVINPDAMCILRGAPNMEAVKSFVRFVMGEAGQKLWAFRKGTNGGPTEHQLNRFTVMPDLYGSNSDEIAVDINPFSWHVTFEYDAERGSARYSLLNDMIGTTLIDSHGELVEAWTKLIEGDMPEAGVAALSAPPVTEDEAMGLSELWGDQELRNAKIGEWTEFARAKYARVAGGRY